MGRSKKHKNRNPAKKPRLHTAIVGYPVPIKAFHYDREKMTIEGGIAYDDSTVKPAVLFSQTHYIGQSGKEKVLTRIHDQVIPNEADLMLYLSSFDLIIGVDTNTKEVRGDLVSASGIVQCQVRPTSDPSIYNVEFPQSGASLFRNCPQEIPPEKYGWLCIIESLNRDRRNVARTVCLVSDHDLDNHGHYNSRTLPIFRDTYLPSNCIIVYGKGDSSQDNLLNYLIRLCDKESTLRLKEISEKGYCTNGAMNIPLSRIPVPTI